MVEVRGQGVKAVQSAENARDIARRKSGDCRERLRALRRFASGRRNGKAPVGIGNDGDSAPDRSISLPIPTGPFRSADRKQTDGALVGARGNPRIFCVQYRGAFSADCTAFYPLSMNLNHLPSSLSLSSPSPTQAQATRNPCPPSSPSPTQALPDPVARPLQHMQKSFALLPYFVLRCCHISTRASSASSPKPPPSLISSLAFARKTPLMWKSNGTCICTGTRCCVALH